MGRGCIGIDVVNLFKKIRLETSHVPQSFSNAGFWEVAGRLVKKGGSKVLVGALTLYYCLRDGETPAWAKSVIVGALGYLILPIDLVPDAIIGAGFADDWSVILGAMASVMAHIKEDHRRAARQMADKLFSGEGELDQNRPTVIDVEAEIG